MLKEQVNKFWGGHKPGYENNAYSPFIALPLQLVLVSPSLKNVSLTISRGAWFMDIAAPIECDFVAHIDQ